MKKETRTTLLMNCLKSIFILTFALTITNSSQCQTGTVGSPFTELGMARNVSSAGVYYFNLTGTTFSSYVDANGYMLVATDHGTGSGGLPQGTALTSTARGILTPTVLSKLTMANEARFSSTTGNVNVVTSNATILSRIAQNYILSRGAVDNTYNSSWTGTNLNGTQFTGCCGCTQTVTDLNLIVFHACGNGGGMHWVQTSNMHTENNTGVEIPSSKFFQLWVRAALVAVVNGPTINTQPSSSAQNICLNGVSTNLTVSASSGTAITYQWYSNTSSSNTGGTIISGATSNTYTPLTTTSGTKYYYVICTDTGGPTTSTVSGAVTINPLTIVGTVSANQTICSGTSPSNIVLTGNTGTVQWQISTDSTSFSNIVGATSATLASATIGALTANRYYKAVVTSGACSSVDSEIVTVTVTSAPTITSTTPGSTCGTGTVSLSATASAGTVNWYAASSGGSSLGTGNTFTTPSISSTTTYYVGVTNGSCSSVSRTAVVATINPLPTATVTGTQNLALDIFVVAGGGGAGNARGGGGGAGGYKYQTNYAYSSGTSTTITVGTGGFAGSESGGTGVHAGSGSNSSFGAVYVATGGGGGGSYGGAAQNGYNGGSGGGGGNQATSAETGYGGTGVAGQGNNGGNSRCGGGGEVSGGGGGGAAGAGANGSSSNCGSCNYRPFNPGSGGNGISNSISGTATYYCGGGGGGGLGANPIANNCTSGAVNLAGANGLGGGQASYGGGGQCKLTSGSFTPETGGPGIVIIRYLGTPVATGGTITQVGGYTIHTFTSNGTFAYTSTPTTQISDASRCGVGTVDFTGTATAGYSLNWYAASSGGTALATSTLTYTTPVLNQSTVYYTATVNTSTGCVAATRTEVNAILNSTSAISANQTICTGTNPANIVMSNYTGTTQWQSSTDSVTFANISGQTSATLTGATVGALTAKKYFRSTITNGACVGNSPIITINITTPTAGLSTQAGDMIWNGLNSSLWATNSNWYVYDGTNYAVATSQPSASIDVIIPVTQTCVLNQPSTVSGIVYAKDLIIENGATLSATAGTIYISGNYENNGTFTPGTGNVIFNGATAQAIIGTSTFYNMSVAKTSGDLTLNSPIKISGTLTMTQGNVFTSNANMLEIGTGTGVLGSVSWTAGTIVGPLKRWFGTAVNSTDASGIFPIGNALVNRYSKINFTQAPGVGGYVVSEYKTGAPMVSGVALYNGLPAVINGQIIQNYEDEGYYEITPYNAAGVAYAALNTSAYTLTLRGNQLTTITDLNPLRIIKSSNHTAWNDNPSGDGTHVAAVGTNSDFTIGATGMVGFSWFNVGSSSDNTLPVELISFSANCNNENSITIKWSTASEFNTSHYLLENSRDGQNWNTINEQDAAGMSTSILEYVFTDTEKLEGEMYYRLTQYDKDGMYETFEIVSVNCASVAFSNAMQIYPNPSNGAFNIRFEHSEMGGEAVIAILDTKGQVVYSETVSVVKGQNMLPLNNLGLTKGIYIVRIQTENGLVSEKVVLN